MFPTFNRVMLFSFLKLEGFVSITFCVAAICTAYHLVVPGLFNASFVVDGFSAGFASTDPGWLSDTFDSGLDESLVEPFEGKL